MLQHMQLSALAILLVCIGPGCGDTTSAGPETDADVNGGNPGDGSSGDIDNDGSGTGTAGVGGNAASSGGRMGNDTSASGRNCNLLDEAVVECLLYYRESFEGGDATAVERTVEFGPAVDGEASDTVELGEFIFVGTLRSGEQEGASFTAGVQADAGAGFRTISSELFQFPDVVCNQFVGDHGFSGLNYVFHPISDGQLQFTCQIQQGSGE